MPRGDRFSWREGDVKFVAMRRIVGPLSEGDGWDRKPGCAAVGLECGHGRDDVTPAELATGVARCPKCEEAAS